MSAASPALSLLLALLTAAPQSSEPLPLPDCGPSTLRIELRPELPARLGPVCISEQLATTFLFDTLLEPGGVVLEGAERFREILIGERTLALVAPKEMEAGEQFRLRVAFADGLAPEWVDIILVAHPAQAARQVEVHRRARSPEELLVESQARVRHLEEENVRLSEENMRLKAATGTPRGLVDLVASGFLSPSEGLAEREISQQIILGAGSALTLDKAWSLRVGARTVLWLSLVNPGPQGWEATGGVLAWSAGEIKVKVWQPAPIAPGRRGPVAVEPESPGAVPGDLYELKLWDASGKRVISLGNVFFP